MADLKDQKPAKSSAQQIADGAFAGMAHVNTVWVDAKAGKYYLHDMGLAVGEKKIEGLQKFTRTDSAK